MRKYRAQGAITVFLSLISVLFISLLCTSVESARIQGCRAKSAAALDMGLFSVFGEFEKEALEQYDVFFLDGAMGGGSFQKDGLNEKLKSYVEYNATPNKGRILQGYDPFALKTEGTEITGYALATDENGGAFYQQAVRFMKENMGTELISGLLQRKEDAEKMQKAGELYEQRSEKVEQELAQLEQKQKESESEKEDIRKQQIENALERGEIITEEDLQSETELEKVPDKENPLKVIGKLKKQGIMKLALGNQTVSQKTLPGSLPSKRSRKKGNLSFQKENSGVTADLLFQEYLFQRFAAFTDQITEGAVDYELEYILCGKNTDEKNLKEVIKRLLLMREGANFLYLTGDAAKKQEADAMAFLLTGWIPIAGVQTITSYALLLAWAYGESLLDVRELMAGGKVPLLKNAQDWKLSLDQIISLDSLLEGTDGSSANGLSYVEYLQILFIIGSAKKYPMRALDLIECNLRKKAGTANFRADHMITKMQVKASYTIPPVFLRVSAAFLKTGTRTQNYEVSGYFEY